MKQHRYPGAQPFSTAQQEIFFGRDEDTTRLHRLIKTEPLVVLYAKSGMGKSSLLNAGLIPAVLRDREYTPLQVRFNAWTEGKADLPVAIAHRALAPDGSARTFLDSLIENEPSLWHELKETQLRSGGQQKFLLLFDQFEELFTYPPEAIVAFKEQLAEALYTKIPQRYRRELERQIEQESCQLRDDEFERLQEPIQIRIVLSIRSDRMHLMERLSDCLPDILAHCYELDALTPAQATAAVVEPARRAGDFISPPFTYAGDAVEHILEFLDDAANRIETVQLQILCRSFEERAVQERITHFKRETLGDLEEIISGFYHRQIEALGSETARRQARLLIEEGLIVAENSQRLTLHEAQIASLFQVPGEHLAQLVNGGLLRAEPALRGGYAYELSHDTLAGPALQARGERRAREAAEARARMEQENAEALAAERRKRQRSRNLALTFALLALLALATAGWAMRQTQLARAAEAEAQRQQAEAERQRQEAFSQKSRADENARMAELSEKKALSAKDAAELQRLLAEKAEHTARLLATKGQRLESTISSADTYGFLMQEGKKYLTDGNYRNALTYFATARFTQDIPEASAAIAAARKGLEAERWFAEGDLNTAATAFRALQQALPDDTRQAQQRLSEIERVQAAFAKALNGQRPDGITTLSLDYQQLPALPAAIGELTNLQTLNLSHNGELMQWPAAIGRLKNLRTLVSTDGNLHELPGVIGRLQALQRLNLLNNPELQTLPVEIGQLAQLQDLNLGYCNLKTLPASIGNLRQLTILNLEKTDLQQLPRELGTLPELRDLKISNLRRLSWAQALPVVFQLQQLERLDLSRSTGLLAEHLKGIAQLGNLTALNLQYNELKSLPPEIAGLKNLKTLNLRNNAFDEAAKTQIRTWLPECKIEF